MLWKAKRARFAAASPPLASQPPASQPQGSQPAATKGAQRAATKGAKCADKPSPKAARIDVARGKSTVSFTTKLGRFEKNGRLLE